MVLSHAKNVSDISVPSLQARDCIATPPLMALAPAGPGATPARWCHDPAQRCSTVSDTTPPVSVSKTRNNRLKNNKI